MGNSIEITPIPNWQDKGTYVEPRDSKNALVPQLQVDDAATYIDKDGSGNMTLTDAVTGTKTLAQLGAGAHTQNTDTDLDSTFEATFVKHADVDDTPVDGVTTDPVSSNWAYDHVAAADPHAGYVLESLYDAYSILMATTDNTPVAITVAAQTLVGRITGGAITALTVAQVKTLLDWAADITTHAALVTGVHGFAESCYAYDDAAVTIANTTYTAIAFPHELWDTDTIHDLSTNNSYLTCKVAGKYIVVGSISWAANVTGRRIARITVNGTGVGYEDGPPGSTGDKIHVVTAMVNLAVNDYVELYGYQSSGGNLNTTPVGTAAPSLSMARIA